MAKMAEVQVKLQEIEARTKDSEAKLKLAALNSQLKLLIEQMKVRDQQAERESREKIEGERQITERLQLVQAALVHPQAVPYAMPFMPPMPGGRVI